MSLACPGEYSGAGGRFQVEQRRFGGGLIEGVESWGLSVEGGTGKCFLFVGPGGGVTRNIVSTWEGSEGGGNHGIPEDTERFSFRGPGA